MNPTIGPPVKCGYCGWLIQGCQNIMQHKCLENYDETQHFLKVDENFVVSLIMRPDATMDEPASQGVVEETVDSDELLIQAVFARPALYNIKLPVKERTKLKKDALWLEVSTTLGGTPEAAKKRWRYLRDCFIKEKNKMLKYKPSGSAVGPSKKPAFRFYEQMGFLNDSLPSTPTVCNIDPPESPDDSGCNRSSPSPNIGSITYLPGPSSTSSAHSVSDSMHAESDSPLPARPPRTSTPGGKKRKIDDRNAELRSALVTAFQEPVPQPDGVDGFLTRLGEGLRRITYRERAALEIKFLAMLSETKDRLNIE